MYNLHISYTPSIYFKSSACYVESAFFGAWLVESVDIEPVDMEANSLIIVGK